MFLHVSVILLTGGVSGEPPRDQGETPPGTKENPPPGPRRTPPWARHPPDQAHHPPTKETPPDQGDPPPGRTLQHMVNERPIRILLECILVVLCDGFYNETADRRHQSHCSIATVSLHKNP